MGSKYLDLVSQWQDMNVDQRFLVMADWWPRLPAALQVALLSLTYAVLGTFPNSETLDTPTPARAS